MEQGFLETKYFKIKTEQGYIYAKGTFEIEHGLFFEPVCTLYEIDTQEPIEMVDNYILFTNLNKCLQYADVIVKEDDEVELSPYDMSEIKEKDIKVRKNKAAKEGISLTDETYKIIKNGVSQKEAVANFNAIIKEQRDEIKKQKEEELKRIQEEKEKYGWAATFYKVFGDLFEDEKRYR